MDFNHIPVLLNECINGLNINPNGVYFDGTLGGGGHSLEIAKRLTGGRLICVDKDAEAILFAGERLKEYRDKITFVHDDFKNAERILEKAGVDKLDGVLLDLGVSSYQIDNSERGFSYIKDAPLDMRMNQDQYLTAFNVVNEYSVAKLERIIAEYGEDKFARRIAERIAAVRAKESIRTTAELAKIVEDCYPPSVRWKFGHPAKRTFQAIRIEVNGELDELYAAVEFLAKSLKVGGRIAIISFHSLEDRIVKNCFKELETDCICDKSLPKCVCGKRREIKILNKKPITASEEELQANSRAESAKLRVAERV
ncbi:MAG: 16S rRNA (cytosine(1402)-N(4))-methyltransferase RsmH [Acidaminococcus sp.]|nr:16S rRNA (cytosine(1402)-N(4))-methyltransferase RsmH [Acidaminococcus sp.]MDD7398520.1 16S rRNA (cytosine(1402)-N(4))-methyltransferase RsmH [Bacillota bacterium]MDY4559976.1 16S rRNA (cytosine(1402)-N(4))-methyltransferase RsmH [Eubacteriales bacterium]MDY5345782.1 16S rRNA (cytosine(1402)-N(4))-methyltransferase RsmH [Eubacteriales bacterium]